MAAVHFLNDRYGVAFLDISTGEFFLAEGNAEYIDKLLQSFSPSEVLFQKQNRNAFEQLFGDKFYTFKLDDWVFTDDFAKEVLVRHFNTTSLKGFGVEGLPF